MFGTVAFYRSESDIHFPQTTDDRESSKFESLASRQVRFLEGRLFAP